MKSLIRLAILPLCLLPAFIHGSGEIDYVERFALAQDRDEVLKHLIPGTEDYYYYHALHYQNTRAFDKMRAMITPWEKQFGRTGRLTEILYRQAIIDYDKDPKTSLEFIRNELGLFFNHQKDRAIQPNTYPANLDPNLIAWTNLSREYLRTDGNSVGRFTPSAHDRLMNMDLNEHQRRALLSSLQRPDHAKMVDVVIADLNSQHSGGFGSLPIHQKLLLAQLDQLLTRMPNLRTNSAFVNAYVTKLRPSSDGDWRNDPKLAAEYLDRVWAFASTLDPVFNSLKLHVLYQRLLLDQSQGTFDKERFLTYIKLPRERHYMRPEYLTTVDYRHRADLNYQVSPVTGLAPVGDDEPLLRELLYTLFEKEESIEPYAKYLRDTFLNECLAEAKILRGIGDQNRWFALLSPDKAKEVRERVEIRFAPTNKRFFGPTETPALEIDVKNVDKLIVRHYLINTENYYKKFQREIDLGITLDGLVANQQKVTEYTDNPFHRIRRRFEFPELAARGAYVVELIGNGKRSRALILKGEIRFLETPTAAGHLFTLLDETGKTIKNGALWMAGREFAADAEGRIVVPFSTNPRQETIVLRAGDFCSLGRFNHLAESYALTAGIHVDRESLIRDQEAKAVVRPVLTCAGEEAPLTLLEHVTLVIQSRNRDGIAATREIKDVKLSPEAETIIPFKVPDDLAAIAFTLKGTVKNISRNTEEQLAASQSYSLNQIEATQQIDDLHISYVDNRYVLECLGRNGEPQSSAVVQAAFQHRFLNYPINAALQTDKDGRIMLGELKEIDRVSFTLNGMSRSWDLLEDQAMIPRVIHGVAGKSVALPYTGKATAVSADGFALLEKRAESYAADRIKALTLADGILVVNGLEPGDYDLILKETGDQIILRIGAGEMTKGHTVGKVRTLEQTDPAPTAIKSIATTGDSVIIALANAGAATRVHVTATRFLPEHAIFSDLSLGMRDPDMIVSSSAPSIYVSGVRIGDEESYILARQYAHKFPGNMLDRPTLLLNPMALKETESNIYGAGAGDAIGGGGGGGGRYGGKQGARPKSPPPIAGTDATLDFLANPSILMANLRPDAKGVITIARKDLEECHTLHILVADEAQSIVRHVALPEAKRTLRDQRLNLALDPKKHFLQERKVTAVKKGEQFRLGDISTAKFESYDDLSRIYGLFLTLTNDAKLAEFHFITQWDQLKKEEKQEKYAKYACHELNYFLYKKDRAFFDATILPYLKNKKDKTFMDRWFLTDDLSHYAEPWAFGRLNVVEQILLLQRIPAEQDGIRRNLQEQNDLLPVDPGYLDRIFETAIARGGLEKDGLGYADKSNAARRQLEAKKGWEPEAAAKPYAPRDEKPGEMPPGEPPAAAETLKKEMEELQENEKNDEGKSKLAEKDMDRLRVASRRLYQKIDKTRAWVENNYYNLTIAEQGPGLVTVNPFWVDYAVHGGGTGFASSHFALANRNFTEIMFALSLLEVPFTAGKHKVTYRESSMELVPETPLLAVYQEIRPVEKVAEKSPILVSQNIYPASERFHVVGSERTDNFITDEFLFHKPYGCQVVVTNTGSTRQKVRALLQIPRGALPLQNGFVTKSIQWDLAPYTTQTVDFFFYFPKAGEWTMFPIHIAREADVIAAAAPMTLKVVEKPSKIDTKSWDHVSQEGTDKEVLDFLEKNNIHQLNLGRIAFRLKDRTFFNNILALLRKRHVYHDLTWTYAVHHNDPRSLGEYLSHSSYIAQCGKYLDTPLVKIDPVERGNYQHIEFSPLVNARAHQLGTVRTIANTAFNAQYHEYMRVLCYKPKLDEADKVIVAYYLLLQDRVEEALAVYERIDGTKLATSIQYDYLSSYVALYREQPKRAGEIAGKYKEYPVLHWRNRFLNVLAQVGEIEGGKGVIVDDKNREQTQEQLAAQQPMLDVAVEGRKVTVTYRNLAKAQVNYYLMDTELLFSLNPFQGDQAERFGMIRPNGAAAIDLPEKQQSVLFDLPAQFHNSNVLIEVAAGGVSRSKVYYANTLNVEMMEQYGQLRVAESGTNKQLPKAYVKVYVRGNDGRVEFFKDGYTDLRGRFDYASTSTDQIDRVTRFAVFIADESHGAIIKEASPPKR